MAKAFSFQELDKALSKIEGFETGSILETNEFSKTTEWISTGNYLLNAQLSGSLFGGIANNRSIGIAGDPSTGKTFLAMNITREAQKQDYDVIYCDTEGAIDKNSAKKFGVDPSRVRYQPIKTINDFKIFTTNILEKVKNARKDGAEPRIMIILDIKLTLPVFDCTQCKLILFNFVLLGSLLGSLFGSLLFSTTHHVLGTFLGYFFG
jgi:RecA/RadA recombinase